ncbi:MAG: hypothetical protein LBT48_03325, partial [Prevotellaceae bacterium]|nr:hypothetical protein [Prevotellaceae bacterium]
FFGSFCIKTKRTEKNNERIGFPAGATAYQYDRNGNTSQEGSTAITYNILNLPQKVQFIGGRTIKNVYAYDGRKLKAETKQGTEYIPEGTKTYNGNKTGIQKYDRLPQPVFYDWQN